MILELKDSQKSLKMLQKPFCYFGDLGGDGREGDDRVYCGNCLEFCCREAGEGWVGSNLEKILVDRRFGEGLGGLGMDMTDDGTLEIKSVNCSDDSEGGSGFVMEGEGFSVGSGVGGKFGVAGGTGERDMFEEKSDRQVQENTQGGIGADEVPCSWEDLLGEQKFCGNLIVYLFYLALQPEFGFGKKSWIETWGILWKWVVVKHLVSQDKSLKEFLLNVWGALWMNFSYKFLLGMLWCTQILVWIAPDQVPVF